jgi:hypothetical protein
MAKQQSKKVKAKTKSKAKVQVKDHGHFIGALALFVGFSVYAMGSFVDSNNDYARYLTSVLDSGSEEEEVAVVVDTYEDSPFIDVAIDSPTYDAVVALYYQGVVSGYDDGSFRPDNRVTRAEFSKMLVEASDIDYTSFNSSELAYCFTDVTDVPEQWFSTPVCVAKVKGWVSGYASGEFGPGLDINRAEASKIVLSAFAFSIPGNGTIEEMPFDDVKEGDWFVGVARAAMDNGIVGAAQDFNPNQQVSRSDVASMIYNAMLTKELI